MLAQVADQPLQGWAVGAIDGTWQGGDAGCRAAAQVATGVVADAQHRIETDQFGQRAIDHR